MGQTDGSRYSECHLGGGHNVKASSVLAHSDLQTRYSGRVDVYVYETQHRTVSHTPECIVGH